MVEINTAQARDFWKIYSRGLYAVPRAWAHKGENLVHAFEAVASASVEHSMHLNMHDQALMLAGMSVEVQLKAILVSMPAVRTAVTMPKRPTAEPARKLWNTFYSHNILALALEGKVSLTQKEQKIASTLSQYIYWRGRYVVPTERGIDDFIPVKLDDDLIGQSHRVSVEDARALIHRVIAEVKLRLYPPG